jgi:Protein of unknown function (DUF2934)
MTIDLIVEQVLSKYNCIEKISYSGNIRTLANECEEYLHLYENLCSQVFRWKSQKSFFITDPNSIAEKIYYETFNDYERKLKNVEYYRGNCSAFNITFRNVLDRLQANSLQELASKKLRGLIRKYARDSLRLINHYQKSKGNNPLFEVSLTRNPDYSLYYDTCKQIIFGEGNFDDPSDQSEVSPALIRIMIELRLKLSMGISGYLVSGSPGNMSEFLEVYNYFIKSNKINVSLRFDLIDRIYKWGNIYIHTGIRSYSWLTGFAINLLNPLFYGEKHRLSGVRVQSQATIYEFWDELKHHHIKRSHNKEIKVDIQPYIPGFICTDNNCKPIPCRNHYAIYENSLSAADSGYQIEAAYEMKCILQEHIQTIGNSLYERVKKSYVYLREKEIRERAYDLWLHRGSPLWYADCDWCAAIEDDINSLSTPNIV